MTGMAQKGGQVTTHLRFAQQPGDLHSTRISPAQAELILGCDNVSTIGKEAVGVIAHGRTQIILNACETITSQFLKNRDFRVPVGALVKKLRDLAGTDRVHTVDASAISASLLGDSLGTNLFMVGYAWQLGLLPVPAEAILQAIGLNATAVKMNRQAFMLGRLAAHDLDAVAALLPEAATASDSRLSQSLDEVIGRREQYLRDYQNDRYAAKYRAFVDRVSMAERGIADAPGPLTEAVARNLFKLMAYKDEYEVARLYSTEAFRQQLRDTFEPGGRIRVHLAPPMLAKVDPVTGEPRKMAFGSWILPVFNGLSALRALRGTPFDLFGYTAERRTERQLITEYRAAVEAALADLTAARLESAVAIARVPDDIRGFGHVKQLGVDQARARWAVLGDQYRTAGTAQAELRRETVSEPV
jgi:indolepyruvate ferredoxin oxidoreductase